MKDLTSKDKNLPDDLRRELEIEEEIDRVSDYSSILKELKELKKKVRAAMKEIEEETKKRKGK